MKQKLTALLLVLLLAVTLVLPVMAAAPYVDDEAAILTLSEVETLEARAAEISEHYGVGVYICIVDDFGDYGYPDAATASYSIYHAQSLGYGSGRDGILLLLSMSNRKYARILSVDSGEFTWPQFLRHLGISFGIGLLLALIVCQLLKMKMRSVYRQAEASAYVTADGLQLTRREDVFTHTTTVRRKIERQSDSSSSSDSSSFSGGGGHGRSGSF